MTKYQKIFKEMLKKHQELFKSFEEVHAQYALDPDMWQEQFNTEGEAVLEVIRDYEDRLCSRSQGSGYASFSEKRVIKPAHIAPVERAETPDDRSRRNQEGSRKRSSPSTVKGEKQP